MVGWNKNAAALVDRLRENRCTHVIGQLEWEIDRVISDDIPVLGVSRFERIYDRAPLTSCSWSAEDCRPKATRPAGKV
jgi:hypothetical protein